MGWGEVAIVLLGALAGGFVNGLAGFGTGLTAMGVWLYALSPAVAATLVIVCSLAGHIQTLPRIWRQIAWRSVLPFILPAFVGIPIGTALLARVEPQTMKAGMGVVLVCYAAYALTASAGRGAGGGSDWGGRVADGGVGFIGGVLGGLAGLSGVLPTIWADIRGWTKAERRSLFQAFNMSVLVLSLAMHAAAGFVTRDLIYAALAALPGTMVGAYLGARLYGQLSDRAFRQVILVLLGLSGAGLLYSNLIAAGG